MNGIISQFAGAYREWAPDVALRKHVRCLWVNDVTGSSATSIQVVPDGCVDIVWIGKEFSVAGPDTRPIPAPLRESAVFVGIRFHPGAALSWVGVPLSEIVNARVPLEEFWGDDAKRLTDLARCAGSAGEIATGLESALLKRLTRVSRADPQIEFLRAAAGASAAQLTLDRLASRMGVSERTLRRRCMDSFGYGFKTLHRVLRFQRFLRFATQSTASGLADLAARAGYADQAHLAREVQRMSGTTAGQLVAQIPA